MIVILRRDPSKMGGFLGMLMIPTDLAGLMQSIVPLHYFKGESDEQKITERNRKRKSE